LQHPPDIAQHSAGLQFTEGYDLRDLVRAIFLLNIRDHFVAAVLTEIDIKVRHGDTFGIQEPFEQQIIAQRVQIRDGQRPGNDRPRPGPTARPNRYFLCLGPLDKIRNDQEVARESHLANHAQFEIQALFIRFGCSDARSLIHVQCKDFLFQPDLKACDRKVPQCLFRRAIAALGIFRQQWLDLFRHIGATLSNNDRVINRFRQI